MNAHIDVKRLLPVWEQFRNTTDITPIRDDAHYARMTALLEALLDEAAGNENHPAMDLVNIVGDLIQDFEAEHYPLPEAICQRLVVRALFLKSWLASETSTSGKCGRSVNVSESRPQRLFELMP